MFRASSKIYPAVLRVPLSHMTSAEVAVFATSITLTPGTLVLSIDRGTVPSEAHSEVHPEIPVDGVSVAGDDGFLLVHAVYAEDSDAVREELDVMLNKVLWASRGQSYASDGTGKATDGAADTTTDTEAETI